MTRAAHAAAATTDKTKSHFILEHPDKRAKDVVALGKSLGFEFTVKYVYRTRSIALARQKRAEQRAAAPAYGEAGDAGLLLVAIAREVGLGRAIEMLKNERQRVLAMLK